MTQGEGVEIRLEQITHTDFDGESGRDRPQSLKGSLNINM